MADRSGFIVKQVAALKQIAAEREKPDNPVQPTPPVHPDDPDAVPPGSWTPPVAPPSVPEQPKNRHFGMTVTLDNTRVVRNVGNLMDEVINHLMNVDGAKVEIRLLVDATMPDGTPVPTVRTVTKTVGPCMSRISALMTEPDLHSSDWRMRSLSEASLSSEFVKSEFVMRNWQTHF